MCVDVLSEEWSTDWEQWDNRKPGQPDVQVSPSASQGLWQALEGYDWRMRM